MCTSLFPLLLSPLSSPHLSPPLLLSSSLPSPHSPLSSLTSLLPHLSPPSPLSSLTSLLPHLSPPPSSLSSLTSLLTHIPRFLAVTTFKTHVLADLRMSLRIEKSDLPAGLLPGSKVPSITIALVKDKSSQPSKEDKKTSGTCSHSWLILANV